LRETVVANLESKKPETPKLQNCFQAGNFSRRTTIHIPYTKVEGDDWKQR
jgi:hypothetical protein